MIRNLSKEDLRWQFIDHSIAKTILGQRRSKKSGRIGAVAQERALDALELGLGIKQRGYNIFVAGASGTGRTSTVEKVLCEKAQKEETPEDLVLLYNFNDRDRPLSVLLPSSMGPKLKRAYEGLIERTLSHLEKAFEADSYILSQQVIQEECREKTDDALKDIEAEARENSFVLSHSGVAITLTPANESGDPLSEEEFETLSDKQKKDLESKAERLENKLEESMRRVRIAEKESEDAFDELDRDTASQAIGGIFESARNSWKGQKRIVNHLKEIEEDILNKIRKLVPDERAHINEQAEGQTHQALPPRRRGQDDEDDFEFDEPLFMRYRVNVLITHEKGAGAPIVFETHPTSSNLIGRIEQKIRAGETVTDFTRIRSGALYRANGGFLILEAQELLRDPAAWEGLKRALKNREIELDDPGEPGRMVAIASLRPEPVPLNLKVILIGTPDIYYALAKNDPDFKPLFKVKADFELEIDRSDENISKYLKFLIALCHDEKLSKLSPNGAGCVIEQAVRLAGQKNKLTCRLGEIADILRESNYWSKKSRSKTIDDTHVRQAIQARSDRNGLVEAQILEEIIGGRVFINTQGKTVGQANALTVVEVGSYEFGTPLRVTCQIGAGKGEIIDIEREAEQSGIFHSKGRLIIRGLLSKLFGKKIPFGFHATLCMEQTYSEVDGDSASLAEACTLLSSLSRLPIDQRFAMTGAIDQMGNVQAVGGINEKIEGFYKVCLAKRSKEIHGVIVPSQNINDIMLNGEVLDAVNRKTFQIIAVDTIQDAMELLTDTSWDKGANAIEKLCISGLSELNLLRHRSRDAFNTPILNKKKVTAKKSEKVDA